MTPLRALASWLLLLAIAFVNGTLRVVAYPASLGDFAARQVAAVVGALLFAPAIWLVVRRWPFSRPGHAWATGALWVALTVLFEMALVRGSGRPWSAVAEQYALWEGSLWPLLLLWVLVAPAAFAALQRRRPRPG
jgi:hypothetical protein